MCLKVHTAFTVFVFSRFSFSIISANRVFDKVKVQDMNFNWPFLLLNYLKSLFEKFF